MKISAITQMMLSTLCAIGLLSAADVPPAAVAIAPSQELLSVAVSRGDVTAVRELLLRGGVSLPTDSIEYDSLVRAAALCGNPDMFDYIPYREPVAGHADSPLIVALRAGASSAMISAMLSAGNSPGGSGVAAAEALSAALSLNCDLQIIGMLQAAAVPEPVWSPGPEPIDEYIVPMQEAVEKNDVSYFRTLPRHLLAYRIMPLSGSDAFHDSGRGLGRHYEGTPLMLAAADGKTALLSVLMGRGANIEACDFAGRTAIVYAAVNGYADCVRLLQVAGARQVQFALYMAAYAGQHAVVDSLLAAGVRPGLAPEWALMSDNPHPKLLSLREPDVDMALGLAVRRNHPGLVTRLVQAGANVNRPNFYPLHEWVDSCPWANDVVLPELLQAGVDITRRRHGLTAAEYAVQQGCYFAGTPELSSPTQPNP